jgi:hypothetical protein
VTLRHAHGLVLVAGRVVGDPPRDGSNYQRCSAFAQHAEDVLDLRRGEGIRDNVLEAAGTGFV